MKRTIAILLVLVSAFSLVFAQGAKEATVTKEVENAVEEIIAEVYKGADYVDPIKGWGRYDALIAAIKAETDTAKRTEMMHEAEDILMSNWCVIPIYYYNDLYMQKSYVSGVYSNPFATKFFQYA
ncbi:MAG: hypothetical protein II493_07840, partial [Spirochaetales bacterium]|nr:hypothetical protein [Spirochaetales bacterium]